jgi:SAM-dependent methyltransferase
LTETVFGRKYSQYYDLVYSDKDYEAECDYLESLFSLFSKKPIKRILDIACGTGGHDIPLLKRGYEIVASDASRWMVQKAENKVRSLGLDHQTQFRVGDMRKIMSREKFDASICMFASLGYLTKLSDVKRTFQGVRTHLNTTGLFVFDFWNGPAVLAEKPRETTRFAKMGNLMAIRSTKPLHDPEESIVSVETRTLVLNRNRLIDDFEETHKIRYFFPTQMKLLLDECKLVLVSLHPFMKPGRTPTEHDWNVTAVARCPSNP